MVTLGREGQGLLQPQITSTLGYFYLIALHVAKTKGGNKAFVFSSDDIRTTQQPNEGASLKNFGDPRAAPRAWLSSARRTVSVWIVWIVWMANKNRTNDD